MPAKRLAQVDGTSTTGTAHSLLLEEMDGDTVKVTIVGHDGKKRHASIVMNRESIAETIKALQTARKTGLK